MNNTKEALSSQREMDTQYDKLYKKKLAEGPKIYRSKSTGQPFKRTPDRTDRRQSKLLEKEALQRGTRLAIELEH